MTLFANKAIPPIIVELYFILHSVFNKLHCQMFDHNYAL